MNENTNISEKKILQEDEIDLIELVKVIWSKKWFIFKVTWVFIILGLIIAFTTPKEYKTYCTLIPEAMEPGGKLGGSLGGLASLAGVDLGGLNQAGSTINPALYRSVAQSTPFLLELMSQKFKFNKIEDEVTLYDYYKQFYEISLFTKITSVPNRLIGLLKISDEEESVESSLGLIVSLSKDQQAIANDLRKRIVVTMDWDLNVVTIEAKMQDPIATAQMAEFTKEYITKYVTNYSLSKSKKLLEFVESQYLQRKNIFEEAQLKLATLRDRNTNINSARARSEEERLQSEYNLAFSIYNKLAQQKESIKLQVNENTPVFTILEPVKTPLSKSEPRRVVVIFISLSLGFIISITYTIIQKQYG